MTLMLPPETLKKAAANGDRLDIHPHAQESAATYGASFAAVIVESGEKCQSHLFDETTN
ncbi:hypothetical protein HPQ64_17675 [Rhizobiales bacterium]|uniref:hypothetical protein n=1 Tax=Hongsoonwoonella zoysiae TaxID=2821844 RepID=UPI001560ABE6|nr:hypothetical protein [Hongsoonwoonella zoysiae]NRG19525.1 hypothetical protein [Hongsoonwoonella zoysiae]